MGECPDCWSLCLSPFVIVAKDRRSTYQEGRLILTQFHRFRPWPCDCGDSVLPSGHTNNRRGRGEGELPESLPWTNFQWSALLCTARIPTSLWCHGLRAKPLTHGPSGAVSPNHGASDSEEKREKEKEWLQSQWTQLPEWLVTHYMEERREMHLKPSGSFLTVGRLRLSITAFVRKADNGKDDWHAVVCSWFLFYSLPFGGPSPSPK